MLSNPRFAFNLQVFEPLVLKSPRELHILSKCQLQGVAVSPHWIQFSADNWQLSTEKVATEVAVENGNRLTRFSIFWSESEELLILRSCEEVCEELGTNV